MLKRIACIVLACGLAVSAAAATGKQRIEPLLRAVDTANGMALVEFRYVDDKADEVYLLGSMNAWARPQEDRKGLCRMYRAADGRWTCVVPIAPGGQTYMFGVRTGKAWDEWPDPTNPWKMHQCFGRHSSVFIVGEDLGLSVSTNDSFLY